MSPCRKLKTAITNDPQTATPVSLSLQKSPTQRGLLQSVQFHAEFHHFEYLNIQQKLNSELFKTI